MSWLVVLEIVLRLLGPVLVKWLEKLLEESSKEMAFGPSRQREVFAMDVEALFDRARKKTWVWQLRKRAAIRLAEKATLARSDEILRSAAEGGYVRPLSTREEREIREAIGT